MSFAQKDLNLSQAELDDLTAALANTGDADPFPNAMAEQEEKVRSWTARYTVPDTTLIRLWRPLVIYALSVLTGIVSDARQKAYDEAMKELADIRAGKFDGFPIVADGGGSGAWGSDTLIAPR